MKKYRPLTYVGAFLVLCIALAVWSNLKKPETTIKNNKQVESVLNKASREARISKSKPQPVQVEMSGFTASFSDENEH